MPRSNSRPSTFRSDSWNRTHIITTRRITSGVLMLGGRMIDGPHLKRPQALLAPL